MSSGGVLDPNAIEGPGGWNSDTQLAAEVRIIRGYGNPFERNWLWGFAGFLIIVIPPTILLLFLGWADPNPLPYFLVNVVPVMFILSLVWVFFWPKNPPEGLLKRRCKAFDPQTGKRCHRHPLPGPDGLCDLHFAVETPEESPVA